MAFLENTQVEEQVQVPQTEEPPKRKKLWDYMTKKQLYTKSFEDFDTQFSTPEKVEKLYDFLTAKKQYSKTKEDFYNQFFEDVKKKEPTQPQPIQETKVTETITPKSETVSETSTNGAATQQPTITPLPLKEKKTVKVEEPQQPKEEDVISLAKQADELAKKTVALPTGGGVMGTSVSEVPDDNAIAQSKELKQKIKAQGYDADELNEAFKDFPESLFNSDAYSKSKLLELNKTNKNEFYRTVATAKAQSGLLSAIKNMPKDDPRSKDALKDWNTFLKEHATAKDYLANRQHTRDIVALVHKYVDDADEQDKILGYFGKDLSNNYDISIKGAKEAIDNDPRKKYLNENELLGLQYFEDINPKLAQTFNNVLVDKSKLDTNGFDKIDKGEELGLQQQKLKLATQGLSLRLNAVSDKLSNIEKSGINTPEEKKNYETLLQQKDQYEKELKDIVNPKNKEYGKFAEYNLDGIAQELFGQRHGLAVNQGLKFMAGVGGNVSSLYNVLSEPFRDDESSKVYNLGQIGRDIKNNKDTYTVQENSLLKQFDIQETPAFTKQKEAILNDPNLTYEQKIQKGIELLSNDEGWKLVAPSSSTNIGLKPLVYGLADAANGLGQFLLTSTVLKGVPALDATTKASNFLNTFTSTFLQSYQPKLNANLRNNEEYPMAKAFLSSSIDGILFGVADKAGAIKKMFNPKSSVGKLINELSDAELNAIVEKSKGGNVFGDILKAALSSGKHALPMTAAGTGGTIINDYINNDLKHAEDYLKEGLVQQAMFTLLGLPMGVANKKSERINSGELAKKLIEQRKTVDPSFKPSAFVEMPSEVAEQQKGEVITTQPKEYKPETKETGVSIILPKEQAGEIITTKPIEKTTTESVEQIPAKEESGVAAKPIEVSETAKEEVEGVSGSALKDVERDISQFANENESYRVIVGDEAFNDIVESGVVRTNADSKSKKEGGIDLGNRPTAFPSFSKGKASVEYANENPNNYIIVTEDASIQPSKSGRHGKGTTMFPTDENGNHLKELSGEKVKVYKHIGNGKYELVYVNGKKVEAPTQYTEAATPKEESRVDTKPIEVSETAKEEVDGVSGSALKDVEYELRRPKQNEIVFVDTDKILARQTKDQPDFDVTKKENQIGGRVQKAKDFISNYIKDNRWINPKTGERTETKVKFEPSIASINDGKLGFEDGRHRILAAKELGLKTVAIEVPKEQAEQFKKEFTPTQYTEAATPKEEVVPTTKESSVDVSDNPALKDVESTAKKILGESVVDKLKKQGYKIIKGKFDRNAYADFFGVGEGVQADEFQKSGLTIIKPFEKIKVFRGVGKNVEKGDNNAIQWVAEDERIAKNYSSAKEVQQLEVDKPQKAFENPENDVYVTNKDVANRLRKIRDNLFKSKKIDKKQAEIATLFIDEFEQVSGNEPELYSTKTNKKESADLYAKALISLGYDGIVQKESFDSKSPFKQTTTENSSNTYGIFNPELVKAVEQLLSKPTEKTEPIVEQKTETITPKKESNAVSIEKANDVDVRKQTTDGERMGEGNTQSKETTNEEIRSSEKGVEQEKVESKELDKLATNIPYTGEVGKYLSGKTILKYDTETELRNNQEITRLELDEALKHGVDIIDKAKQEWGDNYVENTLKYVEDKTLTPEAKALIYVSLENEIAKQVKLNPDNITLKKQQDLIRQKSQAFLRSNALAINMGRLRKFAETGFDISQVTKNFFTTKELEGKRKVEQALQASMDEINAEAVLKAEELLKSETEISKLVEKGVEEEINKLYEKLPKQRKTYAEKVIAIIEKKQAQIRANRYSDVTGMVAFVDAGLTTIKMAIKAGVGVADAIELGINKIKEKLGKEWEKEDLFRKDMRKLFEESGVKVETKSALEKAKETVKEQIESIREQILAKERKQKEQKEKFQEDVELQRLKEDKKTLEALLDKYLPKAETKNQEEIIIKRAETRLTNDIMKLGEQIKNEQKELKTKKEFTSPKLEALKEEKQRKAAILDALDPNPKIFTENALIEKGFGREVNIRTKDGVEKRNVLDWKKLAGEEGSVEKIRENVTEALKDKGYTDAQIELMKDKFEQQFHDLRQSIVDKSIRELDRLNNKPLTNEQKSAAAKLAELYNLGLFNEHPIQHEILLARALGVHGLDEQSFKQAAALGEAMQKMYSTEFNGKKLTDLELRSAVQQIEGHMRYLLNLEAKKHGSTPLKMADYTRTYFDLNQRMALVTLKQTVENPLSGLLQNTISKIEGLFYGESLSKELRAQKRKLASDVFKNMVLEGGAGFGDVNTTFVSKGNLEMHINKMSDNQLFHAVTSTLIGKTTLDAADAYFKSKLTEMAFTRNLVKVLTSDRLVDGKKVKGMSKQEAVHYVTEKLTGQSFKDAQETAKKIIETVNSDGNKIVGDSQYFIDRLANDIVKAALVKGDVITYDMVKASYNSAYKSAGRSLGHEANNFISKGLQKVSGEMEKKINDAVKEKDYNRAAILTLQSIVYRNILNPFVGGGTNWLVLKLEKNGLGLINGLYNGIPEKLDLLSETGLQKLEKALYEQRRNKDSLMRGAIGGATAVLLSMLYFGVTNSDEYRKWRGKNQWASKYTDILTPEEVLATIAYKDDKLKYYLENVFNKNEAFDKGTSLIKGTTNLFTDNIEKGKGQLAEAIASPFGTPIPWRLVRDGQSIWLGAKGEEPYRVSSNTSGILNGAFKGGFAEYIGLRPQPTELPATKSSKSKKGFQKGTSRKGIQKGIKKG